MSQPTPRTQLRIRSLYRADQEKPKRVEMVEQIIDSADSYEQAQTQLAYMQVVETYRLRVVMTVVAVILGITFAAGVLSALLILAN